MLSSEKLYNKRLYTKTPKGRLKKHGNLRSMVFHPNERRAVGFMVKRPDLLLMFKRKDRFVAFDALTLDDDGNWTADLKQADAWDRAACKRLGIDLDECVIWEGMPAVSPDGEALGHIAAVHVDEKTFKIDHIEISDVGAGRKILGSAEFGASRLMGFRDGAIVVDAVRDEVELTGGAAAKAGEAWAKTTHAASEATSKAAEAAGDAVNKGAYSVGKAAGMAKAKIDEVKPEGVSVESATKTVGKQIGRATGMFKSFKDEFDKASK